MEIKNQSKSLGELLVQAGLIDRKDLNSALAEQKTSGSKEPLGKLLVRKGLVREEDIISILQGMLVVVFKLEEELFAFELVYSREILMYRKITAIPATPPHFAGLITLREDVVPVISLNRLIFSREDRITDDTKIIVLSVGDSLTGFLTDTVVSVMNVKSGDFEPGEKFSVTGTQKYVAGVIKTREGIITLLKPEVMTAAGR